MYHNLQKILKKKFGGDSTLIGDEGGFAPPCDCRSGLELVVEAIEQAPRSRRDRAEIAPRCTPRSRRDRAEVHADTWQAGYSGKCTVGLDVAASEFKVITTKRGPIAIQNVA